MMVAVALMTAMGMQAQSDGFSRHEVAVSYGACSNSQWINILEEVTVVGFTFGTTKYENEKYFGTLSAEYFYHPNALLGVGGILTYGQNKQDVYHETGGTTTSEGELSQSYFTLMPAVKLDWLRTKNFGMYSKFAVGATLRKEKWGDKDDSAMHFNWQASLLGIEAGSQNIRAFVELGCGEQGVALAGLRYKF